MRRIEEVVARDIMTKSPICARPDQDLKEVELILIENRIGGVPVVHEGHLIGVVSRSDIARVEVLMQSLDSMVSDQMRWEEVQADGFQHSERPEFQGFRQRLGNLKVKDAMRDQVVTCKPGTPVTAVADAMVRQHIHRIIVVEDDHPVGIISSLDIAKLIAESHVKQKS